MTDLPERYVVAPNGYGLGWRPDLPDRRDFIFAAEPEALRKAPSIYSLRGNQPPVFDQGQLGSCTAQAIGSAHEYEQMRQGLSNVFQPSRLMIYYEERSIEGTVDWDSGAVIRDGFKVLAKLGVCPESQWEYDISRFTERPPAECYKEALRHQALIYQRVTRSMPQMKACIYSGHTVVFGFSVYDSFMEVGSDGLVPLPQPGESLLGGHATKMVGYHEPSGYVECKNSWGEQWGEDGYFWLPVQFILDSSLSSDFWALKLVES